MHLRWTDNKSTLEKNFTAYFICKDIAEIALQNLCNESAL